MPISGDFIEGVAGKLELLDFLRLNPYWYVISVFPNVSELQQPSLARSAQKKRTCLRDAEKNKSPKNDRYKSYPT